MNVPAMIHSASVRQRLVRPSVRPIAAIVSGASDLGRVLAGLPAIAERSVAVIEQLEIMTRDGLTLSAETIAAIGRTEGRRSRWGTLALWVIAGTFIAILVAIRQL